MDKYTLEDSSWDNRDLTTTELHFENFTIEITFQDCLDLIQNMVENAQED